MSASCGHHHDHATPVHDGPRVRAVLWAALIINAFMFAVEIVGGLSSGSMSLWADSLDFAGDAANYAISLAVLSMGAGWRSGAALLKGVSMSIFGVFVLARTGWVAVQGTAPEPLTMGVIGLAALVANIVVALMLYSFREGDANMRSVWLCSRNDAIGNVAVMAAAAGVVGSGSGWPDIAVAVIMASLALSSGVSVLRQAARERGWVGAARRGSSL